MPLLDITNLRIGFGHGPPVVDGVDLTLERGELLCVVGESGSGKSVTALSILRLLPPRARVEADHFSFDGIDLAGQSEAQMTSLRGNRIAMIFQEPMTSLNPVMTIGVQIAEVVAEHRGMSMANARQQALALLARVRIPAAAERLGMYPHQLSGGMRQRVMIAMALACQPALIIADEPTTALDVTIQSQILRLIDELRDELGSAVLFITHNLSVVAEIADRVMVMYAGTVVERAPKAALFADPLHPYTLALFAAMPRAGDAGRRLASIDGQVPRPGTTTGCRFASRCPFVADRCRAEAPPMVEHTPGHAVACWRAPLERFAA